MRELIIRPIAPFDFDLTLGIYSSFKSQSVDVYSPGCFRRVLTVEENQYLVVARSRGTVECPEVVLAISPHPHSAQATERLVSRMRWMMGADLNLTNFYKHIKEVDPILHQVTQSLYGLKPPRTPSVFEALIIAISEQQTSLTASSAIRGRLVRKYGESVIIEGQKYYAFPTPEILARADPTSVREVGFSSRKAACIVDVARNVVGGNVSLKSLGEANLDLALEILTPIKGIGRWTVEYMMCRGMGRYDVLPANDAGLKAGISRFYGAKKKVTEGVVRSTLQHLGEFQGYAAFYLIFAYAFERYGLDPRTASYQLDFGN